MFGSDSGWQRLRLHIQSKWASAESPREFHYVVQRKRPDFKQCRDPALQLKRLTFTVVAAGAVAASPLEECPDGHECEEVVD